MTEKKFWELIEQAYSLKIEEDNGLDYETLQLKAIIEYFKKSDTHAVVAFHEILCNKIRTLYLPKIAELFLLTAYNLNDQRNQTSNYISNDGFIDFRAWIVGLGKADYETFLKFESEDELLIYNLDANTAYREDLVYFAANYLKETGRTTRLNYHMDEDVKALYSEMEWNHLNEKYPKLYRFYQGKYLFKNAK